MMRSALIALALLVLGWAASASATDYKGYYYGAKSPQEIAALVERSIQNDSTGRTMLDAAKCRKDGSCAAPINYLESFQAHDPLAKLTSVAQLPAYLRKLVIDCSVAGEFQMDRIIFRSGTLGKTDVNGMSRSFLKKECAWINPETRRPVLAENCANPVGQRVNLECVYTNIQVDAEHSVIWARYKRPDDPCFAYRRVSRTFERDSARALWHTVPNGCVGHPCDFSQVNAALGARQVAQGEIPLDGPGYYQIRLSPDELLVLCLKLWDERILRSSFASGIRWRTDYKLVGREWHARVYHVSDQLAKDGLRFNEPRGLVFWASNRDAEAEMQGLATRR